MSMPSTATSLPVFGSFIGTSAEIHVPQRSGTGPSTAGFLVENTRRTTPDASSYVCPAGDSSSDPTGSLSAKKNTVSPDGGASAAAGWPALRPIR